MAQLDENFDATQVAPNTGFPVYPDGDYKAQAVRSERKPTKKGDGQFLEYGIVFMGGPYDGQEYIERLNLWNPNQQAVDLARRQFSAMCHATGVLHAHDSEMLHNKPFILSLRCIPKKVDGKPTSEMQNTAIFKKLDAGATVAAVPTANAQAAAGAPAPAVAAAAASGPKTPPWKKAS